jgi:hypothetical protein
VPRVGLRIQVVSGQMNVSFMMIPSFAWTDMLVEPINNVINAGGNTLEARLVGAFTPADLNIVITLKFVRAL